jgi:hypothetical protein
VSGAVSFIEAVEILAGIATHPGAVRALRPIADAYGPVPFDFEFRGWRVEATFVFTGGVATSLASVRIGERYANDHDWIGEAEGNPLDELSETMVDMMGLSLREAAEQLDQSSRQG